jgi:hypothetical protein
VVGFLSEPLELLPAGWKVRCVHADSGFIEDPLLMFLEGRRLG